MAAHVDSRAAQGQDDNESGLGARLDDVIGGWQVGTTKTDGDRATELQHWLDSVIEFVDENDSTEDARHTRILGYTRIAEECDAALQKLEHRLPVFVYFNNYFRVRPNLNLRRFADRVEQDILDDDRYDYGNLCLLKLLGFDARELADLGDAPDPGDDQEAFGRYRSQLDEHGIKLNAASVRLTGEICSIWNPDLTRAEADTVLIQADDQYLNPNPPMDGVRTPEGGWGSYKRDGPGSNLGRWGVGGGLQVFLGAPMAAYSGCGERDGGRGHGKRRSRTGLARVCGDVQFAGTLGHWRTGAVRPGVEWLATGPRRD